MFLNFIPLRERRPRSVPLLPTLMLFQFTPLRKGRLLFRVGDLLLDVDFNSRPYARGDAPPRFCPGGSEGYFNSRPYARGDETHDGASAGEPISIHAPTQGATTICPTTRASISAFQFTPLRKGRQQKICVFSRSFVQPLQIIVL